MADKTRFFRSIFSKSKGFLLAALFCLANSTLIFASDIHMHLWSSLDAYPELMATEDKDSGVFDFPIKSMKETAPFLVNGMVYGWKFTYTPSDKARGVEEFFELTEIQSQDVILDQIEYQDPWISEEDNKFNVWVNFNRNEFQARNFKLWSSIKNPAISGRGYGGLEKGFDGIREASADAVKNAVREHFRNEIKNKPKEISGSVIIRGNPVIGIVSGKYCIYLDFFLECDTILKYRVF